MKQYLLVLLFALFMSNAICDESIITPVKVDPKVFDCTPKILKPGDELKLILGPGHGSELAITRQADGTPFFLVVGSPPPEMNSLMTREEFKKAKLVKISTNILAFAWVADGVNQKIFTLPGEYSIYVSEILESEVGGYECVVTFKP